MISRWTRFSPFRWKVSVWARRAFSLLKVTFVPECFDLSRKCCQWNSIDLFDLINSSCHSHSSSERNLLSRPFSFVCLTFVRDSSDINSTVSFPLEFLLSPKRSATLLLLLQVIWFLSFVVSVWKVKLRSILVSDRRLASSSKKKRKKGVVVD